MGEKVVVSFLHEAYEISADIVCFLEYRLYEVSILQDLTNALLKIVERNSTKSPEDAINYFEQDVTTIEQLMRNEADIMLKKLIELQIYDVTAQDLLENTQYDQLMKIATNAGNQYVHAVKLYLKAKQEGAAFAYQRAANSITGSGVSIFTNSMASLLAYSFLERSVLQNQAKKADQQYNDAVRNLDYHCKNAYEQKLGEVLHQEYYPQLSRVMTSFASEITSNFLVILTTRGRFDFETMSRYNQKRSDGLLRNLEFSANKREILRQAFQACPFSLDVYKKALEVDEFDIGTYNTVKYLNMADGLTEDIKIYFKKHYRRSRYSEDALALYMYHFNVEQKAALRAYYAEDIERIQGQYQRIRDALEDDRALLKWIKQYITSDADTFRNLGKASVERIVHNFIQADEKVKRIEVLLDQGVMTLDMLPLAGGKAENLEEINKNLANALVCRIEDCIQETKYRYEDYIAYKSLHEKILDHLKTELDCLQENRKKCSLLNFKEKRILDKQIMKKAEEIREWSEDRVLKEKEELYCQMRLVLFSYVREREQEVPPRKNRYLWLCKCGTWNAGQSCTKCQREAILS